MGAVRRQGGGFCSNYTVPGGAGENDGEEGGRSGGRRCCLPSLVRRKIRRDSAAYILPIFSIRSTLRQL